jgi:hypothetical protein
LQWGWGNSPAQVARQVQPLGWQLVRPLRKTAESQHLSQMSFELAQPARSGASVRTCIFRDGRLVRVYLLMRGPETKTLVGLFNNAYRQLTPSVWVDPGSGTRVEEQLLRNTRVFTVSPG